MADPMRQMIRSVSRLTTLADIEQVAETLALLLRKSAGVDAVLVFVTDRERSSFLPVRQHRFPKSLLPLSSTPPFSGRNVVASMRLLRKGKVVPLHTPEAASLLDPAYAALLPKYSLLAVPLLERAAVTGLVVLVRQRKKGEIEKEHLETAVALVTQASVVANHIRLFDETLQMAVDMAQRIDIILAIDDINRSISSSLARATILRNAVDNTARMIRCSVVAVLEESKGALVVAEASTANPSLLAFLHPGAHPPTQGCIVRTALAEGRSCSLPDLSRWHQPDSVEQSLYVNGIRSILAIPLVSREKIAGVLLLGDEKAERFLLQETFTAEKIAGQLAVALENARLYEDLKNLFISTMATLANAISAKSAWTKGHSERVMHVSRRIAREMGLDEEMTERIGYVGLLHDIGKIGIIEALLEKPGSLTDEESPAMRLHPMKGVEILAPIQQLEGVLPGILHHHERFDGTGYPDGLRGEEIPLEARIVTVADAFDAMIASRPYREGRSVAAALGELKACAGTQFDPAVVECFSAYLGRKWRPPRR